MSITPEQVFLIMSVVLFILGGGSFLSGMILLILRSQSKELTALSQHTLQLARKGLAEDVSGLVGNASALITAMNDLTKTQSGIGVILLSVGFLVMLASAFLTWYIFFQ